MLEGFYSTAEVDIAEVLEAINRGWGDQFHDVWNNNGLKHIEIAPTGIELDIPRTQQINAPKYFNFSMGRAKMPNGIVQQTISNVLTELGRSYANNKDNMNAFLSAAKTILISVTLGNDETESLIRHVCPSLAAIYDEYLQNRKSAEMDLDFGTEVSRIIDSALSQLNKKV